MVKKEFISLIQNEISLIIEEIDNPEFNILFNFLEERISAPESFVVMLGETSSGKSTIINGLLNSYELNVGAAPTTGAVIEIIEDSNVEKYEYCAVNKDATIEKLSKEDFDKLLIKPDENLSRLRLYTKKFNYKLQYLRLFDTPGYGAIQDYHEEIIKEFIPQSDIIIYVVSYRVGFQNNDDNFVSFINCLIDEQTKFYLVINRIPEELSISDKRVLEITQHASDCLHRPLTPYIIKSIVQEEKSLILPKAEELWSEISNDLKSEERLNKISETYLNLQKDLLLIVESYINNLFLNINLSLNQKDEITKNANNFFNKKSELNLKIENTFSHLNNYLLPLFENASKQIKKEVAEEINIAGKWTEMDDCSSFVISHLLPINCAKQIKIIEDVIKTEFTKLDNDINNILNKALADFKKTIEIQSFALENLLKGISNKSLQKAAGYGLRQFFKQFGGSGGVGAGVANAAKAGLKKLGEIGSHTFSRETHNALAKFLSKVGATSAKAVTAAAAVIIEAAFYVYDSMTWQNKLIKNVDLGVDKWKTETMQKTQEQLLKLKTINIENVISFFSEYEQSLKIENVEKTQIDLDKMDILLSKIKMLNEKINSKLLN